MLFAATRAPSGSNRQPFRFIVLTDVAYYLLHSMDSEGGFVERDREMARTFGRAAYEAEVGRIVAARPYASLTDFWHRARVSRPIAERLVLSPLTVRSHIQRAMTKLDARDRAQLVVVASDGTVLLQRETTVAQNR